MTLPNFIGIGAPRSGSTWLYNLLKDHPDVYVPPKRKDVRYFNSYYERGLKWYESFFPEELVSREYAAIGEFTPEYLYHFKCAERIAEISSISKMILILRNPADRLFSKYKDVVLNKNYRGSFEDFIEQFPEHREQGLYSGFINNYLEHFDKNQILFLIFEESVKDVEKAKHKIAQFLEIDADRFPKEAGTKKVNASYIPRAAGLYSTAYSVSTFLKQQCGFDRFVDWYIHLGKKVGARRLFGISNVRKEIDNQTEEFLNLFYGAEISRLENILARNLDCWR